MVGGGAGILAFAVPADLLFIHICYCWASKKIKKEIGVHKKA